MTPIIVDEKEIPESGSCGYCFEGDYHDIVASFAKILISKVTGSYQGDIHYLLKKDGQFGYLCVGYGSCSYCDMLEGCDTYEEIYQLRDSLSNEVIWKESGRELAYFILDRDWEATHCHWESGFDEFFNEACAWAKGVLSEST